MTITKVVNDKGEIAIHLDGVPYLTAITEMEKKTGIDFGRLDLNCEGETEASKGALRKKIDRLDRVNLNEDISKIAYEIKFRLNQYNEIIQAFGESTEEIEIELN